jgi:azurin
MRLNDQIQFETNIKLVEAKCKQVRMNETKPSKHVFRSKLKSNY